MKLATIRAKRKPLDAKGYSKRHMDRLGYTVANVEQFVRVAQKHGRVFASRFDLYGVFDLLAFDDERVIGVQVTTAANMAAHRSKLETHKNFLRWCAGPCRHGELHVWKRADGVLLMKHKLRRWRFVPPRQWMEVVEKGYSNAT